MNKILLLSVITLICVNCFSQDTLRYINSSVLKNDPKTQMWEKTRNQNLNSIAKTENNNSSVDSKNDAKTQKWEKLRKQANSKNSETNNNSNILDPNNDPKSQMWKKIKATNAK